MSEQQQQQQPDLYQYSVKIEMTAKGLAMPTIHVYSNDMQKAKGLPVATPDFKM
jgi:hypothetical protein